MSRLLFAAIGFVAIAGSCGANDPGTGPDDPPDPPDTTTTIVRTIPVTVGTRVVQAELATTYTERTNGLMGRTFLPDTAGMLFAFAAFVVSGPMLTNRICGNFFINAGRSTRSQKLFTVDELVNVIQSGLRPVLKTSATCLARPSGARVR